LLAFGKGRDSWRIALAICQLLSLYAFGAPPQAIDGFSLDDSWIHQVVARTFASTGTLGYSPGHHGAAATSYLWAILLAGNFRFFHANPVYYTLALNILCTLGVGQGLFALFDAGGIFEDAESDTSALEAWRSFLVVGLACFGGNFLWIAFSGMEQMLLLLASVWGIYFLARSTNPRAPIFAGICAGILAVTRPEAILFGPFLLASTIALDGKNTRLEKLLKIAAPWMLFLSAYVGSNWIAARTVMPATLTGRRWLWLGLEAGQSQWQIQLTFVEAWIMRLRDYTLGTSSMLAFWITFGLAGFGLWRVIRSSNTGLKLLYAWGFAHTSTYAVMLPSPGQGGRYQAFIPLMYLLSVAVGSVALLSVACAAFRNFPRVLVWLAAPAAISAWIGLVAVGVRDWSHDHAKAVSHVRATEVEMGNLINQLPPDARVASFDIGGTGYAAHRPIIDIGGLVEAASADAMIHGDTWKYLKDQRVDYVVLSLPYDEGFDEAINIGYRLRLLNNSAIVLTEIRELGSPPDVWLPSVKSTANTASRQVLYRLTFTNQPGPAPFRDAASDADFDADSQLMTSSARTRASYGLRLLAAYDVHVVLRVTKADTIGATPDKDKWTISLGPWGIRVIAPESLPATASGVVTEDLYPYMKLRDYGGAAVASLHSVLKVTRKVVDPKVYPILPAETPALQNGGRNDVERTLVWGAILALVVFALSLVVEIFSNRARRERQAA
jgi:hypothetical protein